MIKFLVAFLLTALLGFIFGLYFPWWSVALAGFIGALLVHQTAIRNFLAGFAGIFILWTVLAWMIDSANDQILSARIGQLLGLSSSFLLILVTGFIGALVGGLGALTAHYLRAPKRK